MTGLMDEPGWKPRFILLMWLVEFIFPTADCSNYMAGIGQHYHVGSWG